MPVWLFVFLAVVAVLGSLGVILQANPVHALLALALVLVDVGVLFIGLGAETVGFLQIIIYVGAILVLFLFVIWLLNIGTGDSGLSRGLGLKLFGTLGAAAIAAALFIIFFHAMRLSKIVRIPANFGSVESLARTLFSDYLIAFEVTSVLLLAAVAGAIGLARRIPASVQQVTRGERVSSAVSSPRPRQAVR